MQSNEANKLSDFLTSADKQDLQAYKHITQMTHTHWTHAYDLVIRSEATIIYIYYLGRNRQAILLITIQ